MDQSAARSTGAFTQLASLELAVESGETAGACDVGFACAYTNTISWLGPSTPLPTENNPRTVFERLFGDSGSTDPRARQARLQQDHSLLDSLRDDLAGLAERIARPGFADKRRAEGADRGKSLRQLDVRDRAPDREEIGGRMLRLQTGR